MSVKLKTTEMGTVYIFFCDIIHEGHISIIRKAQRLGRLIIGVLLDEAVISYKRFPFVSAEEKKLPEYVR